MKERSVEETKKILVDDMKRYVGIILEEYKDFIPSRKKLSLQSITQFDDKIRIEDSGTISFSANSKHIIIPLGAYRFFKMIRKIPGYGVNKKHQNYQEGEFLNNNTYYDYIKHAFISGMNTEEFYRESILHETMHFCGAGGNDLLSEGFTELKTRELALKYGLITSRSAYPKEVEIASKLQKMLGTDIANSITFAESPREIEKLLEEKFDQKTMHLFFEISNIMNESSKKVYNHSKFGGPLGAIKKAKAYAKVDYSGVNKKLDEIRNAINESRNKKIDFLQVNPQRSHNHQPIIHKSTEHSKKNISGPSNHEF